MKVICGTKDTRLSEVVRFLKQLQTAVWTACVAVQGVSEGRSSSLVEGKKVE